MPEMETQDFLHIVKDTRPRLLTLCQSFFDRQEMAYDAEDAVQETYLLPCRSFKSICAKSILSVTISTISLATILRVTHRLTFTSVPSTLLPIFLANQKSSPVSKSPLHSTSLCSVIPTSSALLNSPPPTPGQPPKNPSRSAHQRASTASLR